MRPQLFSLMLGGFALVIVLGVGGMAAMFGLAVTRGQPAVASIDPAALQALRRSSAEALVDYYAAHGSWQGVRGRLATRYVSAGPDGWLHYTVADSAGRAVASTDPQQRLGAPVRADAATGVSLTLDDGRVRSMLESRCAAPCDLRGQQIGTLYITGNAPLAISLPASAGGLLQGLLGAGAALATVLLGLAALFSRQLNGPLQRLTVAAQTMAAGDMGVRVPRHPVRELDELGQAFNTMADTLAQADQQRRQLTADIAHELRTPLSIMRGRLEGMLDGVYAATPAEVGALLEETALLERLIEDLRLLALADAGQLPLYCELVSPAHLLDDAAGAFSQQAAARGVALHVSYADGLPEVKADPQRIAQVLGNLLDNALRHTPPGGSVCCHAEAAGGRVRISVADSGSGVAPEDLPHIFERFWRADRARSRRRGGAGLGLAIARRLVEAHGGQISAASTPGQGTTISFDLPVSQQ